MTDPRVVIAESRPMLEEFLGDVGIFRPGQRIYDPLLRDRFSDWLRAQEVGEDDVFYLAARIGAFICEYLIDGHSAERHVEGKRILLHLPIDASQGMYREFDPYTVALGLVQDRGDLAKFLLALCDEANA